LVQLFNNKNVGATLPGSSKALKSSFTENDVEYQLVPSHCHRCNAAERAIRNFKEHFVSGLASVDPDFPLHLWDLILPQAEIKLNLLRKSRQHPQLSAAAHYHGMVDYTKTYFAPLGCKIIAHEKPSQRRTWEHHGQHGYSLGPVMHHYSCQNIYISSIARETIVDTLECFPHNSPMSQLSSTDRLLMTANDMDDALKYHHPEVPFSQVGYDIITTLAQLTRVFKNKSQKPSAPELIQAPLKAAEKKPPAALAQPILSSPMQKNYQTRSQRPISVNKARNTPLLPKVFT
jgi:hypothetical protein